MVRIIRKWIREHYNKIVNSIAFYPALISLGFVALSWAMLVLDYSPTGKSIKAQVSWLRLQDADTARNIAATVAAGILSLTVFSFSMVMIVMNQAASNMSNRLLESMIGNRLQQMVLGFYIGTIVYALLLLTAIRDIDSGVHIPALSVYLLILLTIIDIFLFISFLHYITQSVKFETIIMRIRRRCEKAMQDALENCASSVVFEQKTGINFNQVVVMPETGLFQGFNLKVLMAVACRHNLKVNVLHPPGTYLLSNNPLLEVAAPYPLSKQVIEELHQSMDVFNGEPIERNYYYGFRHLTEVALKALSPGLNDPSTAVHSLQALSALIIWRMRHDMPTVFGDEDKVPRVFKKELSIEEIVQEFIYPIWDYGKADRYVQETMLHLLPQMLLLAGGNQQSVSLQILLNRVKKAAAEMQQTE